MTIKQKIAIYKSFNKNLNKEIDSEYIRFYQSLSTNDIFIFMIRMGWNQDGNFLREVVREVVEPLTDTSLYRFRDEKYLPLDKSPLSATDYSRNLEFGNGKGSYRVVEIEEVLPNIQLPDRITVKDIYGFYEVIQQNTNTIDTNTKRKIIKQLF